MSRLIETFEIFPKKASLHYPEDNDLASTSESKGSWEEKMQLRLEKESLLLGL